MTFTGNGIVWNPKSGRVLVNFRLNETYSTDDDGEIDLLMAAEYAVAVDSAPVVAEKAPSGPSKKELVAMAKEAGITGADRMSKGALLEVLNEHREAN